VDLVTLQDGGEFVQATDAVLDEDGELMHGIGGDEDAGIGHGDGGKTPEIEAGPGAGQLAR
jgi:hypothetical protein